MASQIAYRDREVLVNNRQFSNLVDFAIETAEKSAGEDAAAWTERMKKLRDVEFWPGRGIDIEEDFPDVEERKFWARVLYDTARGIFTRSTGHHEHEFWQAQAIHQAYASAILFQDSVREVEPRWSAESIDRIEFDEVVNGHKR